MKPFSPLAAAASIVLAAGPAIGAAHDYCPTFKEGNINVVAPVDKDALAGALLDAAGVPRRLEAEMAAKRTSTDLGGYGALTDRELLIILADKACDQIRCLNGDDAKLIQAALGLRAIFRDNDLSTSEVQPSTRRFLFDQTVILRCKASAGEKPVGGSEAPGTATPTPSSTPIQEPTPAENVTGNWSQRGLSAFSFAKFRVRGASEDIIYDRGQAAYADASKAKLSFGNDHDAGTKTTQIVAALGYPLEIYSGGDNAATHAEFYRVVPYAAVNLDTSTTTGKAKDVKHDQLEFGGAFEYVGTRVDTHYNHFDSYAAAITKYVIDHHDHSALLALNLVYRPYLRPVVNVFDPIGKAAVNWHLIANLRFNNGHFVRLGSRDPLLSHDFSRLGGEFGLGFSSTNGFPIPFDASVSDVYMVALAGTPGHLSTLKADLGIYFSQKKTFGIDLSFSRGRDEDLNERVDGVTIGLTFKY